MKLQNPKMTPEQIEEFFSNKEKALSEMLPKETTEVNDLGQMFAYLISQFRNEIKRTEDFTVEDIKQNFKEMS